MNSFRGFRVLGKLAGTVMALSTFVGCGQVDSFSELKSGSKNLRPVIFAFGGNKSCHKTEGSDQLGPDSSDVYHAVTSMVDQIALETGVRAEYFASCFVNGAKTMAYTSSWHPEIVYSATEDVVRQQIINKRMNVVKKQVTFIGHSYGGWFAMSLAHNLSKNLEIQNLYTLDPISKELCRPTSPGSCMAAPADFTTPMRDLISSNTNTWDNYFQTKTWYLHSSEIEHADYNEEIPVGHFKIDNHHIVWDNIYDRVSASVTD